MKICLSVSDLNVNVKVRKKENDDYANDSRIPV